MADDYAPALTEEEEEQQRQESVGMGYPPAVPVSPVATAAPSSPYPAVAANPDTMKSLAATPTAIPALAPTPEQQLGKRPTPEDYKPAELHGWKKGLGALFTGMAAYGSPEQGQQVYKQLFTDPGERANQQYQDAVSDYDKQVEGKRQAGKDESEGNLRTAQTAHTQAETDSLRNPVPDFGKTGKDLALHDLMTGDNGNPRINPGTGKPYSYLEALRDTEKAGKEVKPESRRTERTVRVVGGVPHEVLIDAQTGDDIKDLGATKVAGESSADKRSAAETVQVEREARTAVHKAEQEYNGARSSVEMQKQFIKEAKGGNKEAVRIVPLEGALQITTSQGVHRINRTEVEQYGSAGSIFDRIQGKIGSGLTGKSIPNDVLDDMDKMTDVLQTNAHDRYKREYEYNKKVVEGYGVKDFDKRVPMVEQKDTTSGDTGKGESPTPHTHGFSIGAWQKANPNGDINQVKAAAKAQGWKLLP